MGKTPLHQGSASSFQRPPGRGHRERILAHTVSTVRELVSAKDLGVLPWVVPRPLPRMGPWRLLWKIVWLDKKEQMNDLAPSSILPDCQPQPLPSLSFPMCSLDEK